MGTNMMASKRQIREKTMTDCKLRLLMIRVRLISGRELLAVGSLRARVE